MAACVAYGCKNRPANKVQGITFHRFPLEHHRRQLWILAVRRANWMPSKCSQLCSRHFEEDVIDRSSSQRVQLKNNAVPTIFYGKEYPTIANQDLLKLKTEPPPCLIKEEAFKCVEPLEDISNDKNRILVVPDGLDVQATFCNGDDKNNVVVIKDEKDLQTVLNCGNEDDIDGNRAIIVSDGRNTRTEWCGNDLEDSYNNLIVESSPYDSTFGEQSLKSDFVDNSKIRSVLEYDPHFYVRRVKKLAANAKKLIMKKKLLHQMSRRRGRKIVKLQKEVKRLKRNALPPKCSTQPIVHVISH